MSRADIQFYGLQIHDPSVNGSRRFPVQGSGRVDFYVGVKAAEHYPGGIFARGNLGSISSRIASW
jgi:hypothetical protein